MPPPIIPASLAEFEEILRTGIDPVSVPSVAYGIAHGSETLLVGAAGFADRERGIVATPSTPYSLASVTKPMTATAIAILADRGLIDLDAPINEYLGDSKVVAMVGDAKGATIRRAANHSAGLPTHHQYFYEDEPYRRPAFDETIRRYCRLFSPPGERYLYSNLGYGLLDHIVERVSGRSYVDFMGDEVFRPLGMKNACIGGGDQRALSYGGDGVAYPRYGFDHPGASEAFGSVEDLLAFGRCHLGHESALLSARGRLDMQASSVRATPTTGYGFGWSVNADRFGLRFVAHSGGMSGVNTVLRLVPELDLVIVILVNGESNLPFEGADNALAALVPSFRERLLVERSTPKAEEVRAPVPSELWKEWSGFIHTYSGQIPLQLKVSSEHQAIALVAGQSSEVDELRMVDGRLCGVFDGIIGTDDAARGSHRIELNLKLRGDSLNGSASAAATLNEPVGGAPGHRRGSFLSYWATLGV